VEYPTHYEILGLSPTSTADEVRVAYRRLIRRHHPDLAGGAGQAITLRLNAAKHTLLDTERRANYDRELWRGATAASMQAGGRPASRGDAARPTSATGRMPASPKNARTRPRRSERRQPAGHPVWTLLSVGAIVGLVMATAIIFIVCYRAPFALDSPRLVPLIGVAVAWVNLGMRKPPLMIRLAVLGSGLLLPLFAAGLGVASRLADAVSPLVLVALFAASLAVAVARFSSRRASATGALRHAG
jgi:molecular chaperone DnaJ